MSFVRPLLRVPGQRSKLLVELELLVLVPDEVEHREDSLVASAPQAAAQLLQEDVALSVGRRK